MFHDDNLYSDYGPDDPVPLPTPYRREQQRRRRVWLSYGLAVAALVAVLVGVKL